MPDQPTWLARVPYILGSLRDAKTPPILDRAAIEKLFQVRRRQGINLMRRFGGYQIGRTFLVSTAAVIQFLDQPEVDEDRRHLEVQKQRVAEFLGEARLGLSLPRIDLSQTPKPSEITFRGLPAGIHLTAHQLAVDFKSATDLLEKLFALSQALANDFETFERALDPHGSTV
jgi:hypothetical protein